MDIVIERMGAGGDGIAAGPIYVPRALPGERVRVHPGARRGDGQAAALEAVLEPSPDRVPPPCPHFDQGCGGCAVQHWAPAAQAGWKRARLAEALSRAGFPDAPVAPTIATEPGHRRRADLALRRTPRGAIAGLHVAGSAEVLDLATCAVLDPRLVALLPPLRTMLASLSALKREGSAVVNLLDTGPDLLLRTDAPLQAGDRMLLARFAEREGLARIAWARGAGTPEIAAQHAAPTIALSGVAITPPPGAFLQASPQGEAAIIAAVLAALPAKLKGRGRIADLHAGLGTLSIPLAARGRVAAFESDAGAVAALAAAAGRAGVPVTATRRDLDRQPLEPSELTGFAAVVLDPPHGGAPAQVPLLARSAVPLVVYVSCNPAALSRDGRAFAQAGWRVAAATPIDQFVHSAQMEAVVAFAR
ncbi:class I SAM-dependent RNA methyltransferase [Roseomonas sp. PWR1]|uniref:Class I SAM-dependent RNA methyltransferase n=1 Tax=Roseomonas nitratireducens TaxID=2820810 RepID=A0ABS4AUC8_9PROT|nr:class I SAM-dependent RNA methyltransferase [Neoroseomonas nitratireducens]MBP0464970.1 class I SAM-dependent RNA methyltransferase [Neoroseomonas nitratireducens]